MYANPDTASRMPKSYGSMNQKLWGKERKAHENTSGTSSECDKTSAIAGPVTIASQAPWIPLNHIQGPT
jgi:hypothetical protein